MRLFRAASPAGFAWNYSKTLAQTAAFWGFFLVVLPAVVAGVEDGIGLPQFEPQRTLAVVVFAAFGTLGLASGFMEPLLPVGATRGAHVPRSESGLQIALELFGVFHVAGEILAEIHILAI